MEDRLDLSKRADKFTFERMNIIEDASYSLAVDEGTVSDILERYDLAIREAYTLTPREEKNDD